MKKLVLLVLFFVVSFFFLGCSEEENQNKPVGLQALKQQFIANYINIVKASYDDTLEKARTLQISINNFVAEPTFKKLEQTKKAWLLARNPYGQTEAYRFYQGPIDRNEQGRTEKYINTFPIHKKQIDYVHSEVITTKTVVNDTAFVLSKNNIKRLPNSMMGYHVIEFLLWGEDLTEPSQKKTGERSYKDYLSTEKAKNKINERRGEYLKFVAQILVEDLENIANQWNDKAIYRTDFLKFAENEAISKILKGMIVLTGKELADKRIINVIESKNQELEQSNFSDNTHNDILMNVKSVSNIVFGEYVRVNGTKISGTSLLDVLELIEPSLAVSLKKSTIDMTTKAKVIAKAKFFDHLIFQEDVTDTTKPVMSTAKVLKKHANQLQDVVKKITGNKIEF